MIRNETVVALVVLAFCIGFSFSTVASQYEQQQEEQVQSEQESRWRPPRDLRQERDSIVAWTAHGLGMSVRRALAIAHVENPKGDSLAVSRAGALGLMQVMPPEALRARGNSFGATQRARLVHQLCGVGNTTYLLQGRQCNVLVGLVIYQDYLRAHRGNDSLALAAYNGALLLPRFAGRYVQAVKAAEGLLGGS